MANSMAFPQLITVLLTALFALSGIRLSSCSQVMGTVSCTDCETDFDFSGIKVLVKCDKENKISEAITDKTGHFKTTIPLNDAPTASPNCWAKLADAPTRLYALKRNTISKIYTTQSDKKNIHTLVTPLVFSKYCKGKCESQDKYISSSKMGISWSVNTGMNNSGDITITFP